MTYLHCARCLDELPEGTSPAEWARTQTGLMPDGRIRVWCVRHDMNVHTFGSNYESVHMAHGGCEMCGKVE